MSRGRLNTVGVVGAYWISSINSFLKTTLPGVVARLRPTSNAVSSVMAIRPRCASAIRFDAPWTIEAPPESSASRKASGLVAR